jgi:hypothetical protein
MIWSLFRRYTVLALLLAVGPALAADTIVWRVGEATFRYTPASRDLSVTCAGQVVRPLVDSGPTFLLGGTEVPLDSATVRLLDSARQRIGLTCLYEVRVGADAATYTLRISPAASGLRLRFSSTAVCTRVIPGRTEGLDTWFRFGYSRCAEPYGQQFWPRVGFAPQAPGSTTGLFLTATWDIAASNGTNWDAPDRRDRGSGPFAAGLDVVYAPRTDGTRLPVDETLTLRVGRELWGTIPLPTQRPSEYAADLARLVFLDVWGGRADETEYLLRHLAAITQGQARFLTLFENWEAGGFDALLPDSIMLPDYPPNPGVGSVEDFQSLSRTARRCGRFGLRTNYLLWREGSPSAQAGRASRALDAAGTPQWFTRPADWLPLVQRQESEIQQLFATDASFSDQFGSAGAPWGYTDYDAAQPGAGAMRVSQAQQRQVLRLIKDTHRGPLGTETLIDETQLGEFMDTGDFGIFDGYHRAFTPEFKLRRLHQLTTVHGMGLMYRYFEMPPFPNFHAGKATHLSDPRQVDDYRAAEVLYGNGGYLFYYPGMPWDYMLTECLVVGTLQRHYALQPVRSVRYYRDGAWQSLLDLVVAGVNPLADPWVPTTGLEPLRRIRVEYANGLQVVVNRLPEDFAVDAGGQAIVLPASGWVAWLPKGKLLAYSAYAPGTQRRIDFIRDETAHLQFVNPRGQETFGETQLTLWRRGQVVARVDPASGDAVVKGKTLRYQPPKLKPLERLDFRFAKDVQGWVALSCLGPLRIRDGALQADIVGEDPYLAAPAIDLAPDSVQTLVIRMSLTCGTFGQLYFTAADTNASAEEMCIHFDVVPDGQLHDIRIKVADHPLWRGHRITSLRLDPEHGQTPGRVCIESIRTE